MRDAFADAVRAAGLTVAIDKPFSGALVPLKHYRNDLRVAALMVEVNRALYLDEASGARLPSFERTARLISQLCCRAINSWRP